MEWPVYFVGLASAFSDCATSWLCSRYPELVERNPLANPFLEAATVLGGQAVILHGGEKLKVNPKVTVALALMPAIVPFAAAANNIIHLVKVQKERAGKHVKAEEVEADYEEADGSSLMSEDQEYAEDIVNRICFAFGAPPPPIRIVEIPPGYAGMYLHDSYGFVAIPKKYLGEGTIAHECGHHLFHFFKPWEWEPYPKCQGEGSPGYKQCEKMAKDIEKWWIHRGRYKW